MSVLMEFKNVSRYFPGKQALVDINCSIHQGEFIFLSGPSGAGKSTFLKMVALQDRPSEGEVTINGYSLAQLSTEGENAYRRKIGFVHQMPRFIHDFTLEENVALPLRLRGYRHSETQKKVRAILFKVGLLSRAQGYYHELSGGERQRAEIARALVTDPLIILADEPTGNLDRNMSVEVMDLLIDCHHQGTTVLFATHDRFLLESYPYRCFDLNNGHITIHERSVQWNKPKTVSEELYV